MTSLHRRLLAGAACALGLATALSARAAGLPPDAPGDDGLAPVPAPAPPTRDQAGEGTTQPDATSAEKTHLQSVFYRADDVAALGLHDFSASYSIETGGYRGDTQKKFGIGHRLQAAFGATRWLRLSAEQNMKNNGDTGELRVGVFAPLVRVTLLGMLPESAGPLPMDVSAYFGPRLRVQGRREPSVVLGLGTNTPKGPFHFTVNQALEVTRANPEKNIESQMGPRYDLGVGYELGAGFVALAELWGYAAWSRGGYSDQEHHGGPSLLFAYGPARISAGGAAGWRDQSDVKTWDLRAMLTTGLEI